MAKIDLRTASERYEDNEKANAFPTVTINHNHVKIERKGFELIVPCESEKYNHLVKLSKLPETDLTLFEYANTLLRQNGAKL